jgi:GAF domain-containing protein
MDRQNDEMVNKPVADSSAASQPMLRFRKASQAVHAAQALDEVLTRVIAELHSTLNAEAASVALLDDIGGRAVLFAAGPVAESISGLELPPGRGIIGWVIASGQSCLVNDVASDSRFWPDVDGYSGFETRSILCAPLLSGHRVIGALEVLNKCDGDFGAEDLDFLEAFGAVAASAIENAQRVRKEQQRWREAEALRRSWEELTIPRSLEELLEAILDQLALLLEFRSAALLLVSDDGDLVLGASRGIDRLNEAEDVVKELGIDVKVRTMLETRQPLLIPDTRTDTRWQHFPSFSYIRSWIGAPLLIKGHLIGTLNVDHEQPGFYNRDHVQVMTNFAHQAAIAIENTQLYAATNEATLQLAEKARRMVTLYEASRVLLSGLELDREALFELVNRITDLIGARYCVMRILAEDDRPQFFTCASPLEVKLTDLNLSTLEHSVLDMLSSEHEVIRSGDLEGNFRSTDSLPPGMLDSFLGVAIHARGRLLGQLLLADKHDDRSFSQDDEALALALATNLAGAIENTALYHRTQQRVRELTALYELSRTAPRMKETGDVYAQLATQVGKLLDAERCAFFIYQAGQLECQAPGYGLEPDIVPRLSFPVKKDDSLFPILHHPDPLISNEVMQDPELVAYRPLLAELKVRRLLSCRIPIDEQQMGFLVAVNKRSGEEFSEQDRHLISIMAHQVSSVLQRALLQSQQREHAQVQSAMLQVSQAISSLTDLDELLQTVAQITHQLVACDHCLIASWDERYTAFVPRAQSGLDPGIQETLSQIHFRPADILFLDQATETRQPILMTRSVIREKVPLWMQELLGQENCLIVPLVIQERVVGLIGAAYMKTGSPPGEREIALVTGIARQAAIAIENANLFQDLQLHAARLERAYRDLKDLDERKTQFIQNVSHELRTPFTLIKGYLELLLEGEMGTLSEQQKEGLSLIAEKTDALGQLINDIMAVQSIDSASLELHEFDLRSLVQTVSVNLKAETPEAHLQVELPADLPRVKADPNMVERVFRLLLDNAIKFSPEGGTITVRAQREAGMLHVEVEDQGIGIPAQALPSLFDRFYQVDGSTTRRFGGAGLGLSIVKQIVEAHRGQVGVHSNEGEGSTFFFTLPLATPRE